MSVHSYAQACSHGVRRVRAITGIFAMQSAFILKKHFKNGAAYLNDVYGGAAIIMALMTPVIIGGLAFGAEVGGWELTKRQIQNATDTAAYAAGTQLRSGESVANITAAAVVVAADSGYSGGVNGVTVESPPATSPNAVDGANPNGDNSYLYVTLTQTAPRNFTRFFANNSTVTFVSSALAKVESGRPACILALHPSASGAVSTGGSTNVSLNGCDIAANSISQTAITSTGNGSSVTADCISAVGNVSVNSTYHLTCPQPIANGPVTRDPYANVPAPSTANCTSNNSFNQFPNQGSGSQRCYTGNGGGISINANTTLAPNATYVFENTGANAASFGANGNRSLTGTNVTLYFRGKWNINFNGNTSISITAPTTGTYKGLAIFGDRTSEVNFDNRGNNTGRMVGAVYSPNRDSDIVYSGSSTAHSAGQCTQVIGGTVTFWGNSSFTINCSNSGTTPIMAGQSIKIVG